MHWRDDCAAGDSLQPIKIKKSIDPNPNFWEDSNKMNDITLADNGTALVGGTEFQIHYYDRNGQEAITIPDLDLISYDEGDTWEELD